MYKEIVTVSRITRIFFLTIFFTVIFLTPFTGEAEDIKWLVPPAFEGEELAKVREWEKIWAGKKVNRSNVEQIKELVPEGVYEVITDTSKWGDYDFGFEVVPYQTFKPTPGLMEATQTSSPLAHLTSDESLENYHTLAGVPFPNPTTGLEIAWNFFMWTHGDQFILPKMHGSPVDARTKIERGATTTHWEAWYVNRVNKDPKPAVPKNRRKIRLGRFMHMETPPHMTDFCSLHIEYIDLDKQRDGWMYWPRFRKITRIETSTRDDVYDGLDWIQDDFPRAWNDIPQRNRYKLIGRKELLLCRHADAQNFNRKEGMVMFSGLQRELINTYVVEAIHKSPGYIYGKQLWFIDPETWVILYKLMYNRQGQPWKLMECYMEMREIWGGEVAVSEGYGLIDLIRRHGSNDYLPHGTDLETDWNRDRVHSIRNLDRRAY